MVLVITAGSRLVQAAVTVGITFYLFPELLNSLFTWVHGFVPFVNASWSQGVAFILFGFGAFTYAKHPEGIIEAQTTREHRQVGRPGRPHHGVGHPGTIPPIGEPAAVNVPEPTLATQTELP